MYSLGCLETFVCICFSFLSCFRTCDSIGWLVYLKGDKHRSTYAGIPSREPSPEKSIGYHLMTLSIFVMSSSLTYKLFWCFSCYLHLNKWITVVAIDKEMSRSTAYWQKRIRYVPSRNWIALNESRKLMLVILEKGKGPCLLFCWRVEQSNRSNIVSSKQQRRLLRRSGEGKKRKRRRFDRTRPWSQNLGRNEPKAKGVCSLK